MTDNDIEIKQSPDGNPDIVNGPKFRDAKIAFVWLSLIGFGVLSFIGIGTCLSMMFSSTRAQVEYFLGPALQRYSQNNWQLPVVENWCDVLSKQESFAFSTNEDGTIRKECSYAVNPEAMALGSEAPDDMVLLFPSIEGWNLSGGPELMRELPIKRIPVLMANFKTKLCRSWELPYMRWQLSDTGEIPHDGIYKSYIVGSVILILWTGWVLVCYRRCINKFWLLALLPAVLGAILGSIAQGALYAPRPLMMYVHIGEIFGGVVGLLAGVHYLGFFARRIKLLGPEKVMFATDFVFWGVIAGGLSSTITHILLTIAYSDQSFWPLLAGLGFGCWSGAIVGLGACFVFKYGIPKNCISEQSTTGDVL